ncbi:7004_t:CDS:2 [Entrophospora sp. SA101]|nr:7004_t:CDS:2 [Entrophospora sp. SA101]
MKLKIEKLKKENGQLQTELYQQQVKEIELKRKIKDLETWAISAIPNTSKYQTKEQEQKESIKMKVQQEEEELFDETDENNDLVIN